MNNPLDPQNDNPKASFDGNGYILNRSPNPANGSDAAAEMIRGKLDKIYASEPNAEQEEQQAEAAKHRSKHQQFMHELNNSGKDLAQIQTEWHNYYVSLPDDEKHIVWQEFYASNKVNASQSPLQLPVDTPSPSEKMAVVRSELSAQDNTHKQKRQDRRSSSQVQKAIREHTGQRKIGAKQHLQSLLFGLGTGVITIVIFLFSFFNEVIIAPFIQPARTSAATPLIVGTDTVAPTKDPQVIIPKINVQIPIQFDIKATDEETMQKELEQGVAHYPTTASPGENGNAAYFGHSSNNIFNKGHYKFAFVLLHELQNGDIFYITKDGKLYAYKVFSKTIVEPTQTDVLNPVAGHVATATLITCDPPGTSLHRLVVVGDQISPDPNANAAAVAKTNATTDTGQLAGNGRTLWGRLTSTFIGKAVVVTLVIAAFVIVFRRTGRKKDL